MYSVTEQFHYFSNCFLKQKFAYLSIYILLKIKIGNPQKTFVHKQHSSGNIYTTTITYCHIKAGLNLRWNSVPESLSWGEWQS